MAAGYERGLSRNSTDIPPLRGWGKPGFGGNAILPGCRPYGAEEWNGILCSTGISPLRGWEKPGFGGRAQFYRDVAPTGLGKTRFRGGMQFYRCVAPMELGKRRGFLVPNGIPLLRGWGKTGFGGTQFYRCVAPHGAGKEERIPCSYRYTDPAGLGKTRFREGRKSTDVSPPTGLGKTRFRGGTQFYRCVAPYGAEE